jgi:hypothetical protein
LSLTKDPATISYINFANNKGNIESEGLFVLGLGKVTTAVTISNSNFTSNENQAGSGSGAAIASETISATTTGFKLLLSSVTFESNVGAAGSAVHWSGSALAITG